MTQGGPERTDTGTIQRGNSIDQEHRPSDSIMRSDISLSQNEAAAANVLHVQETEDSQAGTADLNEAESQPESINAALPPPNATINKTDQNYEMFSFIIELTGKQKHRGKPFRLHLFNVYRILKEQDAPEDVCNAGLFHSIYGTEFFNFRNNRITRDIIRGMIGDYAEELVHIFCTTKRRFNVFVNNTLQLDRQKVMDLCYIEYANALDQNESGMYDKHLQILNHVIGRLQNGKRSGGTLLKYKLFWLHHKYLYHKRREEKIKAREEAATIANLSNMIAK